MGADCCPFLLFNRKVIETHRGECEREVTLICYNKLHLHLIFSFSRAFYLTISGGSVHLPILSKVCTHTPCWLLILAPRYSPELEMSPTSRCTWPSAPGTQWEQWPVVSSWPPGLGPICGLLLFGHLPWSLTPHSRQLINCSFQRNTLFS